MWQGQQTTTYSENVYIFLRWSIHTYGHTNTIITKRENGWDFENKGWDHEYTHAQTLSTLKEEEKKCKRKKSF